MITHVCTYVCMYVHMYVLIYVCLYIQYVHMYVHCVRKRKRWRSAIINKIWFLHEARSTCPWLSVHKGKMPINLPQNLFPRAMRQSLPPT